MAIQLKNIVLLFLLFTFVKLDKKHINMKKGYYTDCFDDDLILEIEGFEDYYLKVRVEGNIGESDVINHVVSYYQDENLSERKQLAQSLTNKTIMWLNNEQTKEQFYISIECSQKPCSYDIYLDKTEVAELSLNDQYTYYVTEENKCMEFAILKEHESDLGEEPYVAVSVRGNKKVETHLEGGKYESKDSYTKIKYENFKKEEHYLRINGEVGDLINVGIILYYESNSNNCNSDFEFKDGEEISSYLDPAYSQVFRVPKGKGNNIGYYYDINNKFSSGNMFTNTLIGMITGEDSLYYSMQYITDTTYDGRGNNKYSPLLDGVYTIKQIIEGTTIGLIPMKPRDNFKFLTYEVFPIGGEISVSIYECDNYPLCHLNDINERKLKKIDNSQSYYYSYNKNEFKNISPIGKKQKMLLIKCEAGLRLSHLDRRSMCSSIINMKTDNKLIDNTAFNLALPPYQRFIIKNNIDRYLIRGTDYPIHLYIEKISGDIEIEIDQKYTTIKDNFYIIKSNKDTEITITANKNSIYSINNNYQSEGDFAYRIGYNYVMNLEKDNKMVLTGIEKLENIYQGLENDYQYFFKITPLNCDIKLQYYDQLNRLKNEWTLKENDIFQDKLNLVLKKKFYTVSEASNEKCLLYISSYNTKESLSSENSNGITFGNDSPQTFIFNEINKEIVFSYADIELENDVKIKFEQIGKPLNEYKYNIKVNGEYLKKNENFEDSNEVVLLKANDIKDKCDSDFICKILVKVESQDENKESSLKITVTSVVNGDDDDDTDKPTDKTDDDDTDKPSDKSDDDESDKPSDKNDNGSDNASSDSKKDDDDDDDDKVLVVVLLIVAVVIIIGAAIGLYFYFRVYSKNKDLSAAVNQISFKDNDKNNDDDEIGDSLLD